MGYPGSDKREGTTYTKTGKNVEILSNFVYHYLIEYWFHIFIFTYAQSLTLIFCKEVIVFYHFLIFI